MDSRPNEIGSPPALELQGLKSRFMFPFHFLLCHSAISSLFLPSFCLTGLFMCMFARPLFRHYHYSKSECDYLLSLTSIASTSRAEDPGFESRLSWDFPGSSHSSVLKIGTPVATLPGAWCYRVSTGTGWPGVSILWLSEVESLVCNFCLSVAAR